MKILRTLLLLLLLSTSAAWAEGSPAGTFVFRFTSPRFSSTATLAVLGGSSRTDDAIQVHGEPWRNFTRSVLTRAVEPTKTIVMDHTRRIFVESEVVEIIEGCNRTKYTAEKIGHETIGKWKTTHVRITSDSEIVDRWTTTELDLGGRNAVRLMEAPIPGACTNDPRTEAAEAAGGNGVLVKQITYKRPFVSSEQPQLVSELVLVRHDSRAPDASRFERPTGYGQRPPPKPPEVPKEIEEIVERIRQSQTATGAGGGVLQGRRRADGGAPQ